MLTTRRHAARGVTILALIGHLAVAPVAFPAPPDSAYVIERLDANAQALSSLHFDYTVTTRNYLSLLESRLVTGRPELAAEGEITDGLVERFNFYRSGSKYARYTERTTPDGVTSTFVDSNDDQEKRNFSNVAPYKPRGHITFPEKRPYVTIDRLETTLFYRESQPSYQERYAIREDVYGTRTLSTGETTLDGNPVVTLRWTENYAREGSESVVVHYLDPARNYCEVFREHWRNSKLVQEWHFEDIEESAGVYLPRRVRNRVYVFDRKAPTDMIGKLRYESIYDVETVEVNEDFPDTTFRFNFPDGTLVVRETGQTQEIEAGDRSEMIAIQLLDTVLSGTVAESGIPSMEHDHVSRVKRPTAFGLISDQQNRQRFLTWKAASVVALLGLIGIGGGVWRLLRSRHANAPFKSDPQ